MNRTKEFDVNEERYYSMPTSYPIPIIYDESTTIYDL